MRLRTLTLAILLLAGASAAMPAVAGETARADQRLAIWTPDQWVVVAGKPRFEAHNPQTTISVVAARIPGAGANALAAARAFIEEELDEVEFSSGDLAGMAEDEGDDVAFAARTIVDGPDLLVVLTYGDAAILGQAGPRQAVERVRASLKVQ
jgi:hypothetical protein